MKHREKKNNVGIAVLNRLMYIMIPHIREEGKEESKSIVK